MSGYSLADRLIDSQFYVEAQETRIQILRSLNAVFEGIGKVHFSVLDVHTKLEEMHNEQSEVMHNNLTESYIKEIKEHLNNSQSNNTKLLTSLELMQTLLIKLHAVNAQMLSNSVARDQEQQLNAIKANRERIELEKEAKNAQTKELFRCIFNDANYYTLDILDQLLPQDADSRIVIYILVVRVLLARESIQAKTLQLYHDIYSEGFLHDFFIENVRIFTACELSDAQFAFDEFKPILRDRTSVFADLSRDLNSLFAVLTDLIKTKGALKAFSYD